MTMLTLPEARTQLTRIGDLFANFTAEAHTHIETPVREDLIDQLETIIGGLDELAASLPIDMSQVSDAEAIAILATNAMRIAALVVMKQINPDQVWYWTPEWQAKDREAEADLAAGRVRQFASDEELLAALKAERPDVAYP